MPDKEKLKKNGGDGTAVGNFLRSLNFKDVAGVIGSIATGNIPEAIKLIAGDKEMTEADKQIALRLLEMDVIEMQEVTKRLETDNEHNITRLVRPLTYALMFLLFMSVVILDGNIGQFSVNPSYLPTIESLFTTMTVFYFGSRGLEKMMKTFKK